VTERSPVAATSLAVGAVVAISMYVAAFRAVEVGNLGWDAAGSVVQMRAASLGILDLPGTRPGVGVAGSFVAGVGLVPVSTAPIVLSIAAVASLGLAAAVTLRRAWALPGWGLGVAVLLVATWGGTARLASGYLANLLSLVLFLVGAAIAIGPAPRWWAVGAAFAAALFAHPGLLPAYGAILLGWVLMEVARAGLRDGRERRSIPAAAAFVAATLASVGVVAGVLGVGLDELQDLALARERFDERAAELLAWIDPLLTLVMVVLGVLVAVTWRGAWRSRAAARLGIAWLAVSAGGLGLLAIAPEIPGHRTLLLGVPAPILGALAIVGGARWIADRSERRFPAARAAVLVAAALAPIAIAFVALRPFEARASRPVPSLGPGADVVAGYLLVAPPDRPVAVVMDPGEGAELLTWKARLNAVRALAPDPSFLDVVLYVGDERALLAGRASTRPGDARFQAISARTWPSVREILDERPVILVVRPWVTPEAWERVAGSATLGGDDLAVVRGPMPSAEVRPVEPVRLPLAEAAARVAIVLLVFGVIGGGWATATSAGSVDPIEAVALAPATGLAVVTLPGILIVLAGGDPGGPLGLVGIGAVGVAGWIVAWRAGRIANA
jgi:hypothetical protein